MKAGNELSTFGVQTFFCKKSNYLILYAKETKDIRNSKRRTQNPSKLLKKNKIGRATSSVYLEQFENKFYFNYFISINPEFNIYCLSCSNSINSINTGKHASTATIGRGNRQLPSELAGSPLSFLIRNFSLTPTAKEHS